LQSFIPGYDK